MPLDAARAAPPARGTARHDQRPPTDTEPLSHVTVAQVHDMSSVRDAAMRAAERGWFVFPTSTGSKEPRKGLAWGSAATADLARLARATWRPGENYGIAAKPSGLVVVDLDMPKPGYVLPPAWRGEPGVACGADVLVVLAERAGVTSWAEIFGTFTVATPGGGQHLYYLAPVGRMIGNRPLGPLIDIRAAGGRDGGYVLGPGSVIGGRAYEVVDGQDPAPLPAWIADLLDPPARDAHGRAQSGVPVPGSRPGDRIAARLDGLIATVLDAKPGERNNTLHWAACRAAEMVAAGQVSEDQVHDMLGRAAALLGLDDGEARRTILSALRQPLRRTA